MRTAATIALMLGLMGTAGGIGFYFGIKEGADVMATLTSQNEVSRALARIRVSTAAIERNSISYSVAQHERDIGQALFDLGVYAPTMPYWACRVKDREAIKAAKIYIAAHPGIGGLPPKSVLDRALGICGEDSPRRAEVLEAERLRVR
ncbi:hypothetical protein EA660_16635 [Pseudoxanthomonas winnipegensis]|uniref:Uncharacterized protein n=1 Tax=Pseudoxanthomonas winnipegensis TaxID=2480810 RepID=A0A4Q8L5L6_9GAMM|nr:hypothetical protein EA660_16635 [Pseudoxanthomonas winnipegensis]